MMTNGSRKLPPCDPNETYNPELIKELINRKCAMPENLNLDNCPKDLLPFMETVKSMYHEFVNHEIVDFDIFCRLWIRQNVFRDRSGKFQHCIPIVQSFLY